MTEKTKKKDPRTPATLSDPRVQNMSLRDYFAAHALAGLLTAKILPVEDEVTAEDAYAYADAMMEARKQ